MKKDITEQFPILINCLQPIHRLSVGDLTVRTLVLYHGDRIKQPLHNLKHIGHKLCQCLWLGKTEEESRRVATNLRFIARDNNLSVPTIYQPDAGDTFQPIKGHTVLIRRITPWRNGPQYTHQLLFIGNKGEVYQHYETNALTSMEKAEYFNDLVNTAAVA